MTDTDSTGSDEMYSNGGIAHHCCGNPRVRRMIQPLLGIKTAADALPSILYTISINGKMAAISLLCGYVGFILLMLPFWLLSKLITEAGLYALTVAVTFIVGRALVRLLVFPGSSHRVYGEIETEFARYSVRMLQTASNSFVDVASTVLLIKNNESLGSNSSNSMGGSYPSYDTSALWKRAQTYHQRVLRVYVDVLGFLYDETNRGGESPYGDIGNLAGVSLQAKSDGRALLILLRRVLNDLNTLEERAPFLNASGRSSIPAVSDDARNAAKALISSANELRDVVSSFKPQSSPSDEENQQSDDESDDDEEDASALRRRLQRQSSSSYDVVKSVAATVMPMLDPPPHSSIFGLDVLRGCVLSRYRGSRQFWVHRPGGGKIDVLYIPSVSAASETSHASDRRKAVLYCNPNAGLIEVAAGMSLAGGNVNPESDAGVAEAGWTDFYHDNGYDVYLFNYAGYGRSHGLNLCSTGNLSPNAPGVLAVVGRILQSTFLGFKPSPDTLRKDAATVGKHIINEIGVESLVVHGESIGGMAAAGAARELSSAPSTKDRLSLLICDRAFCNLEGVAQRLVGSWTGFAIRCLVPLWNTDVAGDFLAVGRPKLVATDAADMIISDASSLKAGVAYSREITNETKTKGVGWIVEAPLEYRMADWENVGVLESQHARPTGGHVRAPIWPVDKHITLQEAFHFAACARRVGKVATSEKNRQSGEMETDPSDEQVGIEVTSVLSGGLDGNGSSDDLRGQADQDLQLAWKALACCDGLCGAPLGLAVKESYDCTVSWLCSTLTFGGQVVVEAAEQRALSNSTGGEDTGDLVVIPSDFDCRPQGYENDESEMMVHPIPITSVIASLKALIGNGSIAVRSVDHEVRFCLQTLEYVVARLSSPQVVEEALRSRHLGNTSSAFLNLHCGHNNPYSSEERLKLRSLLDEAESMQ